MNTEITSLTLVLTGPLAGETMMINGRQFRNGRTTIVEPANKLDGAIRYYGLYYQAYPEGSAALSAAQERDRLRKLKKEEGDGQRDHSEAPVTDGNAPVRGDVQPTGAGTGPEAPAVGPVDAAAPAGSAPSVAGGDGQPGPDAAAADRLDRLRQAVSRLNPKDKVDWTSDGLPSVDAVTRLFGSPVTRAELDALGVKRPESPRK